MPLFTGQQIQYYINAESFDVDSTIVSNSYITLTFDPLPASIADFDVFVNGSEISSTEYDATPYNAATGRITFDSAPTLGDTILVQQKTFAENRGNYQYITLKDAVNNFIFSYVGEGKIISKIKRADVLFHAQRCIQELSYDTLRSSKSQEIEVPPSLVMALPHDYVNYVKVCWSDDDGVERILQPASKTSNPRSLLQDGDFDYMYDDDGTLLEAADSDTWTKYKTENNFSAEDDTDKKWDIDDFAVSEGRRFGLEPQYAQTNGLFFIDQHRGNIHVNSTLSGKTIIVHYISDGVATEDDKIIHKFAEEAVYKWIAHAILSIRNNVPEYVINRFKKERFAAIRQAKLRLSNLKSEEITQIMRGKSKIIKH